MKSPIFIVTQYYEMSDDGQVWDQTFKSRHSALKAIRESRTEWGDADEVARVNDKRIKFKSQIAVANQRGCLWIVTPTLGNK